MTQNHSQPEGGEHGANEPKPVAPELQALIDLIKADPERTAEELKKLRLEAKQNRLDAEAAETQRKAEELAKLEEGQQWEKANTELKRQLKEASDKAGRVDDTDAFLRTLVQRRVESLLPHHRALVRLTDDPRADLEWLEANASALNRPQAQNIGGGERGDGGGVTPAVAKLTAEQLALAKQAGMTPEQFAHYLNKGKPEGAA